MQSIARSLCIVPVYMIYLFTSYLLYVIAFPLLYLLLYLLYLEPVNKII